MSPEIFWSFNPCCAGCSSGSASTNWKKVSRFGVSILVVLDVVLEVLPTTWYLRMFKSFNPCCAGCSSGSIVGTVVPSFAFSVSILVVLDVVLED